jgi:hypothetical protein
VRSDRHPDSAALFAQASFSERHALIKPLLPIQP